MTRETSTGLAGTSLMSACYTGNIECVKAELEDSELLIDQENEEGSTALMYACFAGQLEIVKLLIEARADWSVKNKNGVSAIDCAKEKNHTEIVNYLEKLSTVRIRTHSVDSFFARDGSTFFLSQPPQAPFFAPASTPAKAAFG